MATRSKIQSTTPTDCPVSSPRPSARPWAAWLLLALVPPFLAAQVSGDAAAIPWPAPNADWVDDAIDDLEDAADALGDAGAAIGSNQGPLQDPLKTQVSNDLNAALAIIDRILDPAQYWNLEPPDAGEILTSYDPSTLPDYARDCATLAQDARDEVRSAVIDHRIIGSNLKTIRHLITRAGPHNYRTKGGLDSGG